MKIEIDTNDLIKEGITLNHYLFLQYVYHQDLDDLRKYRLIENFFTKDDITFLMSIELLSFVDPNKGYYLNNLAVTQKFIDLYEEDIEPVVKEAKKTTGSSVEEWIEDWYQMWPKGIKSGSYPVRSGIKGCLKKMKKFIADNPEFKDKDLIFKATGDYIAHSRMNNYKFMQLAHYFISKNNISNLAANCELILSKNSSTSKGFSDDGEVQYIDDI